MAQRQDCRIESPRRLDRISQLALRKQANGIMSNREISSELIEQTSLIDDFLRPYASDTPLIRMGDFADGGYLVPDDLRGIAACYSPGVSMQASFELDMAKRGIPSYMADASVEQPSMVVPGAQFVPKFLGREDKGEFMTLETWVAQTDPNPQADLLLQMDIEGAEYAILAAAPRELLRRFRMIVIELHQLPSILTKPRFMKRATAAFCKLQEDFVSVHLHPILDQVPTQSNKYLRTSPAHQGQYLLSGITLSQ